MENEWYNSTIKTAKLTEVGMILLILLIQIQLGMYSIKKINNLT